MDAFISSFSDLSKQLIPILGAAALIFVIILLYKLIKIFSNLNQTVDKTNKTIDLVDDSIDKIQAPLDTAVKISHTVDKVHDTTVEAVASAKDFVVKTAGEVKNKVVEIVNSDNSSSKSKKRSADKGE